MPSFAYCTDPFSGTVHHLLNRQDHFRLRYEHDPVPWRTLIIPHFVALLSLPEKETLHPALYILIPLVLDNKSTDEDLRVRAEVSQHSAAFCSLLGTDSRCYINGEASTRAGLYPSR